jgi:GAF domain-containing protein
MSQFVAEFDVQKQEALKAYIDEYGIDSIIKKLIESLLRHTPSVTPKEHWAHVLRMEKLKNDSKLRSKSTFFNEEVASEVPGRYLKRLFQAIAQISCEITPADTINLIISEACKLLNCDRVLLLVHDKRTNMLVLNAADCSVPVRVKPGQGVAGLVFNTQEIVNLKDCYKDAHFDSTIYDETTGYRTERLLAMPILDCDFECVGVVEAINKHSDTCGDVSTVEDFTHIDEILLEMFSQQVAVALRNAEVYKAAIVASERSNALLQMLQSFTQDLGMQSANLTITMHARGLVQADRCTVYLVDEAHQRLVSICSTSGKEIATPKNTGIVGECATTGKLITIGDCYQDSRLDREADNQTGYKTTSMLAVPVLRQKRAHNNSSNVLAVIEMVNKTEFDGEFGPFDEEDIDVMLTFAAFLAPKLEGTTWIKRLTLRRPSVEATEVHMAFEQMNLVDDTGDLGHRKSSHGPPTEQRISEEE